MTEPVSGDVPPPLSVSGSGGIHPSVMLFCLKIAFGETMWSAVRFAPVCMKSWQGSAPGRGMGGLCCPVPSCPALLVDNSFQKCLDKVWSAGQKYLSPQHPGRSPPGLCCLWHLLHVPRACAHLNGSATLWMGHIASCLCPLY